jgi:ribosome maturation factor RimP
MRRRKHPVVEAIESETRSMVEDYGYELVDITCGGPKRNPVLTIMIDKPGGVTADDCAAMSKRLGLLLDVLDPIPTSYQFAVSSPGVERPLTKLSDFERFAGREAEVRFDGEDGRPRSRIGRLGGLRGDAVVLEVGGEELQIPQQQIEKAHLTFSWDDVPRSASDRDHNPAS